MQRIVSILVLSSDGKFLYASNRSSENNLAIFSINSNGILKALAYQEIFGKHPRTFAIDPSGKFLVVTNVNTKNIIVFKRDLLTGLLKKTAEVNVISNPSCVKIHRY